MYSGLIILLCLAGSCKNNKDSQTEETTTESPSDTLPGEFVRFYDQFHGDSAFQMDHITFPLEGLPVATDENDTLVAERFFWQRADWKIHNHFTDPGQNFEQWFVVVNDRVIEHWIKLKGTNLQMRRRFAQLGDGWYLIYYQGLRPVATEEVDGTGESQ